MSIGNSTAEHDLNALRAGIAGQVSVPGQTGYDQARQAWNLAVDQRPDVVVVAESASDVVTAIRYARAHGMRIAPQGTGHGAAPLDALDGAMLLRTTPMRKVDIDPASRIARAEAGALWQDVMVPAAEHGLAGLAGSSPNVGVTGDTLGGGLGWLARRYGLAANSVTAAELVTPDGDLVRADAGHEPDLLWPVRCGRACKRLRTPSHPGTPATTTTTSKRSRSQPPRCSRPPPSAACKRSKLPTTPTG